jgi:hypothetical protein
MTRGERTISATLAVATVLAITGVGGACGRGTPMPGGSAGATGSAGAAGSAATAGQTGAAGLHEDASAGGGSAGVLATSDGGDAVEANAVGAAGSCAHGSAGAPNPLTQVVPTSGCGHDTGESAATFLGKVVTMGTKAAGCADTACGSWMYTRYYVVTLPFDYDKTKAYPLVLEAAGCGSTGLDTYPLTYDTTYPPSYNTSQYTPNPRFANVANTVIRVGLVPPPNEIGHPDPYYTSCFDEAEGDDSVEWPYYEGLYDQLEKQLCFDKNRVFASGFNDGALVANQLGCKYAGDASRPIRAVLSDDGGLTQSPAGASPTCTDKPMAGLWVNDFVHTYWAPFSAVRATISRAMKVNGCTIGTGIDDAQWDPFPIGLATACRKIRGCPDLTPLVFCPLPSSSSLAGEMFPGGHPRLADPAFATFIAQLESKPAASSSDADAGCATGSAGSAGAAGSGGAGSTGAAGAPPIPTDAGPTDAASEWVSIGAAGTGGSGAAVGADSGAAGAAGSGESCAFPMPNQVSTGLPNPASYKKNPDGTVTEAVSGLTWQVSIDAATNVFDATGLPSCAAKGAGWRLPTRLELVSLLDVTVTPPAPMIDQAFFPNTPIDAPYAASTMDSSNNLVQVDFGIGTDTLYGQVYERCVRAPPKCSTTRYQVQADGVVLDSLTGLTWQQTPDTSGSGFFWNEAKDACAARGAGWRLPSLRELETIVDVTNPSDALYAVFPTVYSSNAVFWTSSPASSDPTRAWIIDFTNGISKTWDIADPSRFRCVR